MMYDALHVRRENDLNRKPLGVLCSNLQDFLLSMMPIYDASFNKIGSNGYEKLELFDLDFSFFVK